MSFTCDWHPIKVPLTSRTQSLITSGNLLVTSAQPIALGQSTRANARVCPEVAPLGRAGCQDNRHRSHQSRAQTPVSPSPCVISRSEGRKQNRRMPLSPRDSAASPHPLITPTRQRSTHTPPSIERNSTQTPLHSSALAVRTDSPKLLPLTAPSTRFATGWIAAQSIGTVVVASAARACTAPRLQARFHSRFVVDEGTARHLHCCSHARTPRHRRSPRAHTLDRFDRTLRHIIAEFAGLDRGSTARAGTCYASGKWRLRGRGSRQLHRPSSAQFRPMTKQDGNAATCDLTVVGGLRRVGRPSLQRYGCATLFKAQSAPLQASR